MELTIPNGTATNIPKSADPAVVDFYTAFLYGSCKFGLAFGGSALLTCFLTVSALSTGWLRHRSVAKAMEHRRLAFVWPAPLRGFCGRVHNPVLAIKPS